MLPMAEGDGTREIALGRIGEMTPIDDAVEFVGWDQLHIGS